MRGPAAAAVLTVVLVLIGFASSGQAEISVSISVDRDSGLCKASDPNLHVERDETVEFTNATEQTVTLTFSPAGATDPGSPVSIDPGKTKLITITGPGDTSGTADETVSYTIESEACRGGSGQSSPRILIDPGTGGGR
ncbi:MAG: hypothetical protein KAJ97_00075 [Acidobacteria bacterium]|nr:hypothetical protein [Acidobacteriota bacterium]